MKIKVPEVFELGTCELVAWSFTHCASEMPNFGGINFFTMRLFGYKVLELSFFGHLKFLQVHV